MFEIQRTHRLHKLVGRTHNGDIINVPDLMCVRKHMEPAHKEMTKFLQHPKSKMFAFVSSPHIIDQQNSLMKDVKVWCHPFKNRAKRLADDSCKYMMMPESDFMDMQFVRQSQEKIKYDFFYMTLDAKAGIQYKGIKQFVRSLPVLCGELNLKCVVIVYYPAVPSKRKRMKMLAPYKKIISRYQDSITFVWGWQKQNRLSALMSSCKFGFFPNTVDCSPRLIPECILRDKPVMINQGIWGGWHYVNENTGALFNPKSSDSIKKAVDQIMRSDMSPADTFMNAYGFVRSSERLATFLSETFDEAKDFTHIYFSPYRDIMKEML